MASMKARIEAANKKLAAAQRTGNKREAAKIKGTIKTLNTAQRRAARTAGRGSASRSISSEAIVNMGLRQTRGR